MRRGNPDRAGLVAADRHIDRAGRHERGAARRRAARGMAALDRILDRAGHSGVAAAGIGQVFAYRFAGDFAAGIQDACDDGRVERRHEAVENIGTVAHRHLGDRDRILHRDPPARQLPLRRALDRGERGPGVVGIFFGGRTPPALARIAHRRQPFVERGDAIIGEGQIGAVAAKHRQLLRRQGKAQALADRGQFAFARRFECHAARPLTHAEPAGGPPPRR